MTNPDRYAVFGNPIHHSKSPILHAAFAKQTQQDIIYTAECIAIDQFTTGANTFFANGGKVTVLDKNARTENLNINPWQRSRGRPKATANKEKK